MGKSLVRSWLRIVLCYWLLMSVIFFLEFRYMASGWAGLPGFLLTLPLSTVVVGAYFLASYAAEFRGYNIRVTDYHAEFGFMVCAFLNAFIFYPIYLLRMRRRQTKVFDPPPPPNVLRISVGRGAKGRLTAEEAATQFCVGLSRVSGYLEFE